MKGKTKGSLFVSALLAALIAAGCTEEEVKVVDTEQSTPEEAETTETAASEEAAVIVKGDTINSHFQADAVCVVDSRFERGHSLVFRANVIDSKTNATIEDAKVKVVLGNGEEYEMKMGPHGEEGTILWTVLWTIPDDFPTGTLDYKLIAEVDGKEYTHEPFNVSLSKLTILEKGAEEKLTAEAKAAAEAKAKEEAEGGGENAEQQPADGEGDA
ncbi:hypothetical protein SAMN05880501_10188 [Ureibacillus xyleni]|uniref:Intracellular proteinase inhibitor BsuPI n=1 Tax=Ureibacillus xyleni TaxID=614648 RepID=A0A285R7F3_9BACL|nr:hypothetical protein [Ureibacillus xyleni]SOB90035.1 hypothetical protein SAMN05880501_10188 [Ureibacillus xyleni]